MNANTCFSYLPDCFRVLLEEHRDTAEMTDGLDDSDAL